MATQPGTIEFLLDQLSTLSNVRAQRMFGEYALYHEEKVFAFVCDNELFIKPTVPGREFVEAAGALDEAPAYPGSKLYLRIGADRCENREWLAELVTLTSSVLPAKAPKAPKVAKAPKVPKAPGSPKKR
ncbi:MAG: TfoX/Sxy family protein [Gemmatimonadota bacterium]|jgi:TfoX/Sxy family transcriptional regulator of competence genes|nr:TfoX/Sxy family protein [Gemmatimonadota bacterium]